MKKQLIALLTTIGLSLSSIAYADCDQCTELTNIDSKVSKTNLLLTKTLTIITTALFSKLPDMGNTMAATTAIPSVNDSGFAASQDLLKTIESQYGGKTDGTSLSTNYNDVFNNYLLGTSEAADSFSDGNASASSLFLNQNSMNYYTDAQQTSAEKYISLLSGAAASSLKKPDSSWITPSPDSYDQQDKIRKYVTSYYQARAANSLIAYNLSSLYADNWGTTISGDLDNYSDSEISARGLIQYMLKEKIYNPDWYSQLSTIGIGPAVKELVIISASCFLELVRIENLMEMQVATQSASLSMSMMQAGAILQSEQSAISK